MKILLTFFVLFFSSSISFNSYGDASDKTICVETDGQDRNSIIFLPNQTEPFTGNNLCEYGNGQFKSQGKFKDGIKDGKWTTWFENGQIQYEATYKVGTLVVETKYLYYESGQIEAKEYYKDELDGKVTLWYEDGQIKAEGNYKDGKGDGKWIWWYEDGQIKSEKNYKDGECISGDC